MLLLRRISTSIKVIPTDSAALARGVLVKENAAGTSNVAAVDKCVRYVSCKEAKSKNTPCSLRRSAICCQRR